MLWFHRLERVEGKTGAIPSPSQTLIRCITERNVSEESSEDISKNLCKIELNSVYFGEK